MLIFQCQELEKLRIFKKNLIFESSKSEACHGSHTSAFSVASIEGMK